MIVSTLDGSLHCFGDAGGTPVSHPRKSELIATTQDDTGELVGSILSETGIRDGYDKMPGQSPFRGI